MNVSPACAGMIPVAWTRLQKIYREPRMRGDDPALQTVLAQSAR